MVNEKLATCRELANRKSIEMKTILVSDDLYSVIESAVRRANKLNIESFLQDVSEIKEEMRRAGLDRRVEAERMQLERLKEKPVNDKLLWQKFARAMHAMYQIAQSRFSLLEGLTKEVGSTVYVSSEESRIRNSAQETKPIRIDDSIWFVNTHVSKVDAANIIDKARGLLGLSPDFGEELKKATILAEPLEYQ